MAKSADAFRTISEVSEWLDTPAHVLRFWESKFSQVKPVKRAGGRRYYRPSDMELLGGIKRLLHEDGMTIKGVQKLLREKGVSHVSDMSQPLDAVTAAVRDAMEPKPKVEAPAPEAEDKPEIAAEPPKVEEPEAAEAEVEAPKAAEPEVEAPEEAAVPDVPTVEDPAVEEPAPEEVEPKVAEAEQPVVEEDTEELPVAADTESADVPAPAVDDTIAAVAPTAEPAPSPKPSIKAVQIEHRPTVLSLALARTTPLRPEDKVEVRRLATRLQNWLSRQPA